ncbi:hypothetical protein PPGU16_21690 [Paraburkholderia largidicola]|uniref:Uncharacterized protein n=1 Tax=Paraburkholderia largidicola TaxID=3014751 RepID=A0A7I8BKF4_9BURK|nr:hypothetical protein PPGU16_21690 [Paraburkholderia sp. PGU16]
MDEDADRVHDGVASNSRKRLRKCHPWAGVRASQGDACSDRCKHRTGQVLKDHFGGALQWCIGRKGVQKRLQIDQGFGLLGYYHRADELANWRHLSLICDGEGKVPKTRAPGLLVVPDLGER